jgi:hypothetical protein
MRNYTNNQDGRGNGPWTDFVNFVYKKFTELQFYDSTTVKVRQTTRGVTFHVKPGASPATGMQWQTPDKELDPTKAVSKNTLVYISTLNTLVTAGMTDIVSNANVISCEGIWQAAQNVPAATGGKYNVPVFPYPSGMGTTIPSGSPLSGDLDSATIFWIYWGQVAC